MFISDVQLILVNLKSKLKRYGSSKFRFANNEFLIKKLKKAETWYGLGIY